MHYHLVTTDGAGGLPAVRTVSVATDAEREALRLAMAPADWAPKRYPGRTWKRGEVAVYLDRTNRLNQSPSRRELSLVRCPAGSTAAPDCLLRAMGIPALNLQSVPPAPAAEPVHAPAVAGSQRTG
jgi:hypothetical protein